MEHAVAESQTFPPTPTIPVLAVPILYPDIAVQHSPTPEPAAEARQIAANTQLDDSLEPATTRILLTPTPTETALPTATTIPSPTPCASAGQIETGQIDSALAGRISYRAYLPPCYSQSGRTYPVLYMLPGNIYTDSIWDELGLDEAAEAGIKEGRYPPFIIVMVSGGSLANNTSGGSGSYETFLLEEFIPHIEQAYCVLPYAEGRAIGGMSRGAYWALEIAFRHAADFVSVGGHSAALVDYNGGPQINPSDTGLSSDLDDLRIYLDIGENDWLLNNTLQLHNALMAADREHTWVLNEGIHEEAYWAEHVTDYLDWYVEPWLALDIIYPPCRAVSSDYAP